VPLRNAKIAGGSGIQLFALARAWRVYDAGSDHQTRTTQVWRDFIQNARLSSLLLVVVIARPDHD
jgi:hypothetical protein